MTLQNSSEALKAVVADRAALQRHFGHAETAPLLKVLVHPGSTPGRLDRIDPRIKGSWSFHDDTPDAKHAELREAVAEVLTDYARTDMRNRPKVPHIKSLQSFSGSKFHTARWDQSADCKGKRFGMIRTGASGIGADQARRGGA